MPTKRGRQVLSAALGLTVAGRVLGVKELFELGMLLLLLVAIAVGSVVRRNPTLSAKRVVVDPRPQQHAGVRVVLTLNNHGKRTSPSLRYVEAAPRSLGSGASVALPPLQSGKTRSVRLEFKAERRGVYRLGPGELSRTDPFGLAQRTYSLIKPVRIVVYPVAEDLALMELSGDHGPGKGRSAMAQASIGKEFYALRQFQEGDDQRKIHWPSTARLGRTMIRQEEQQSHLSVTVLIDPSDSSSQEYEKCVCSAASVLKSLSSRGHPTRLLDGPRTYTSLETPETYHHAMERLARSSHHPTADTSYLWHEMGDGLLMILCARPHVELVRRLTRDKGLAARTLVIAHRNEPATHDERIEAIRRAGGTAIEVPGSATLGGVWKRLGGANRPWGALAR